MNRLRVVFSGSLGKVEKRVSASVALLNCVTITRTRGRLGAGTALKTPDCEPVRSGDVSCNRYGGRLFLLAV